MKKKSTNKLWLITENYCTPNIQWIANIILKICQNSRDREWNKIRENWHSLIIKWWENC